MTVPRPKEMHSGNVEIYVFIYMRTYGELWIDDVTLTPIAE